MFGTNENSAFAVAGDHVTMQCKYITQILHLYRLTGRIPSDQYDEDKHFYNQTVLKNGRAVITDQLWSTCRESFPYLVVAADTTALDSTNGLKTASPLSQWGPQIESEIGYMGDTPAHVYWNTTIKLNTPAPDFAHTLRKIRASNSPITSPDGGTTWNIERIDVPSLYWGTGDGFQTDK